MPATFLLPAPTGKPAVGIAVPLPVVSTTPDPIPDFSGIIVNEGPEHKGVATAERVTMSFVDEGG
jgi:hypothetical protein